MAERTDPFEALRRPAPPIAPRQEFAAQLRRRMEQELGMTTSTTTTDGTLAMVHLRVADADRAMAFFGELFEWDGERVEFDGRMNYYTLNTEVTVRLIADPDAPAVVPNYRANDVGAAIARIEAAGGHIDASEVADDGGGWARGRDDQGLPLLVYRPRPYDPAGGAPRRAAGGEVGLVFIREDAERARRFYRSVFGWPFERVHPDSHYFDTVTHVAVFDEGAAFDRPVEPNATIYIQVPVLAPFLAKVNELGGRAGAAAQDMGPFFTAMCTDDQGTEFGLMSDTHDG